MFNNTLFSIQNIGKERDLINFIKLIIKILLFMKTNKKAILGMLVAMVISLGAMGGISLKTQNANLQQVGIGCGYMAGVTEGGASGAWAAASNLACCTSSGMAVLGAGASIVSTTNPVGWGYWAVTGVIGL
jgi:hypothetical protein